MDAMHRLIEALAAADADEYLRETSRDTEAQPHRQENPVLPATGEAA